MTKSPVIAAIDAGCGFTKFTSCARASMRTSKSSRRSRTSSFTTAAAATSDPAAQCLIPFGTHPVEVGPDIEAALGDAIYHLQSEGFAATDDYRACVAGALAFIEEPIIDMLVLTVPMRERDDAEPQIRDWLSRPVRTAANSSVTVARVEVLAQAAACAIEWFDSPESSTRHRCRWCWWRASAAWTGRCTAAVTSSPGRRHRISGFGQPAAHRGRPDRPGAPAATAGSMPLIRRFAMASPCGRADNCTTCSFTGRGSTAAPAGCWRHRASPDRTADTADRVAGRRRRSLLPAGRGGPVRSTGRARGRRADARVRAGHVPVRQAPADGRPRRPARLIHREANPSHSTPRARGARGDDCELDASSDRAIFDLTPAAKQQIQLTRLRAAGKAHGHDCSDTSSTTCARRRRCCAWTTPPPGTW